MAHRKQQKQRKSGYQKRLASFKRAASFKRVTSLVSSVSFMKKSSIRVLSTLSFSAKPKDTPQASPKSQSRVQFTEPWDALDRQATVFDASELDDILVSTSAPASARTPPICGIPTVESYAEDREETQWRLDGPWGGGEPPEPPRSPTAQDVITHMGISSSELAIASVRSESGSESDSDTPSDDGAVPPQRFTLDYARAVPQGGGASQLDSGFDFDPRASSHSNGSGHSSRSSLPGPIAGPAWPFSPQDMLLEATECGLPMQGTEKPGHSFARAPNSVAALQAMSSPARRPVPITDRREPQRSRPAPGPLNPYYPLAPRPRTPTTREFV